MNGVYNGTFSFGLWGPGEGPKGQIFLNIIKLQSQFQRFLNQSLCVYSQMKDIKHIRRDFHLAAWVMPQGLGHAPGVGLGGSMGGWRGQKQFLKFNQSWCVSYLHEWHMQRHNILGSGPPGALGRGQKVKYH